MTKAQERIYRMFRENPPVVLRTELAAAYANGYRTTFYSKPNERIRYSPRSEYWAAQKAGRDNAKDSRRRLQ